MVLCYGSLSQLIQGPKRTYIQIGQKQEHYDILFASPLKVPSFLAFKLQKLGKGFYLIISNSLSYSSDSLRITAVSIYIHQYLLLKKKKTFMNQVYF